MGSQLTKHNSARILSLAVALVLVLLPFHAFFTTWAGASWEHLNTWRLWPEFIIVLAALPLATWQLMHQGGLTMWLKRSLVAKLYLAYILLSVAVGAWSYHQGNVSKTALALGLGLNLRFIGFFLVCQVAAAADGFLKRWWPRLILWPGGIVVVFGLMQKFILPLNFLSHFGYGTPTVPAYQTVDAHSGPARLQSTLRGPNPLGAYLALVLPAWRTVFNHRRLLAYIGLALGLVVLFYSYSRSALAATLICLVTLAWWLAGQRERRAIAVVVVAAVVLAASFLYLGRNSHFVQESLLHTSSSSTSADSSNFVRRAALRSGWHDLVSQPAGNGPGTAGPASQHNQSHKSRIAENYYLQLGQEVGAVGLLIFLAINIEVALQLWRARATSLAKILLVSLAGISLINLVSHAWTDDTLSLLWWGLAGIALAPNIAKNKNKI